MQNINQKLKDNCLSRRMDRRNFLKNLGFVTVGIIIAPRIIAKEFSKQTIFFPIMHKFYQIRIPDNGQMDNDYIFYEYFLHRIEEDRTKGIYTRPIHEVQRDFDMRYLETNYVQQVMAVDCPKKYWKALDSYDYEKQKWRFYGSKA